MLNYKICNGEFLQNGTFWGTGYSGAGYLLSDGRNNPDMVQDADKGPIPPGMYSIGAPYLHPIEGPMTMDLTPLPGTNVFGRSGFHIHGNNARNDASLGCIILGPTIREQIIKSGENLLTVSIS